MFPMYLAACNCRMTSESNLLDAGYGGDPLSILGDELRERGMDDDTTVGLVMTEDVQQNLAMIAPWLKNREPFILVSPCSITLWCQIFNICNAVAMEHPLLPL